MQSNPTAVSYPISFIASMLPFGWVLGGLTTILGISVLLVAANAGVVGISRIAYSMSEGGVIPKVFGRVHHRFRTPYVAIIVFSSLAIAIVVVFSAQLDVLAEMYNFGALIAYMIVGLSLISLRNKEKSLVRPFKTPWNIKVKGMKVDSNGERRQYEIPVLAVGCFTADLIIWLLVVILHPIGREVGTLWIVLGLMLYYLYTRIQRSRDSGRTAMNIPGSRTDR
jgi:APA family basic amino acid/polyamine antiporter